ncbi:MAG: hypothetical protein NTV01_12945 [Bacteroidia bacterium]|nr:hypothetical protein [Bacteroidia bacterium]
MMAGIPRLVSAFGSEEAVVAAGPSKSIQLGVISSGDYRWNFMEGPSTIGLVPRWIFPR